MSSFVGLKMLKMCCSYKEDRMHEEFVLCEVRTEHEAMAWGDC
jgi:hypothetical protein